LDGSYSKEIAKTPHHILLNFANAISEKYDPITARFNESSRITTNNIDLVYSFYIEAPIGRGYYYLLFESVPAKNTSYPVKTTLYVEEPKLISVAQNAEEFENILLNEVFSDNYVKKLIVDLTSIFKANQYLDTIISGS
jgi:hypothetical protein